MKGSPRLRISIAFLVVANLIPVFGVLYLDWDVFYVMLLFWCENVIVGIFGILRMASIEGGVSRVPFFLVHYGMFMYGHITILIALFADDGDADLLQLFSDPATIIALLALFVSHGWSFATNFLGTEERARLTPQQAMALPYRRLVATHVALILGGALLGTTGQPIGGLLVLVGIKVVMDVIFHRREHNTIAI